MGIISRLSCNLNIYVLLTAASSPTSLAPFPHSLRLCNAFDAVVLLRPGKPSKLAYRKVLCETATDPVVRICPGEQEKEAYASLPVRPISALPSLNSLIPFSLSVSAPAKPVALVCPREEETRKAVSGNISTNPRTHTRDVLFARIPPRDVYFVETQSGVARNAERLYGTHRLLWYIVSATSMA